MASQEVSPQQLLGRWGAIAIIVGIVVGAGIFKTPSMVASVAGDTGWVITIWVAGALISLAGALCYAELSCAYPHTGGDYHFLARAYGRHVSFLYAWAKAMVINTGAIALLGFVFGDYMTQVISLGEYSSAIWAAGVIVLLTLVNLAGLHLSSRVQSIMLLVEFVGLAAIIAAGLMLTAPDVSPEPFSSTPSLGLMGLALVFVLLTFGGWNEAAYIATEVKGGTRQIVPVVLMSLGIITALYLMINLALLHGLGLQGLAKSPAAAAQVMGGVFGEWAKIMMGVIVALAALTSINATIVVGARSNHALGQDWEKLRFLSQWEKGKGAPTTAYIIQSSIALALVGFGALQNDGFEAMVEFTAPVFWVFLTLVGLSLFVLRHRDPSTARPFKVPLYPLTPLLFIGASGYLAYSSIGYAASQNAVEVSLWVMAAGLLALAVLSRLNRS
jgi:amino acid transporter